MNKKFKITMETPTGKKTVGVTARTAQEAIQKALDGRETQVLRVIERPINWTPKKYLQNIL